MKNVGVKGIRCFILDGVCEVNINNVVGYWFYVMFVLVSYWCFLCVFVWVNYLCVVVICIVE